MKVRTRKGTLILTIPMFDPLRLSKSKMSLMVASSRGPRRTAKRLKGQNLIVNVNAYIRSDEYLLRAAARKLRKSAKYRRLSRSSKRTSRTLSLKHRDR